MYTRSIKYIKLNNFTVTLRELETCVAMPIEWQDQSSSNRKNVLKSKQFLTFFSNWPIYEKDKNTSAIALKRRERLLLLL